MEGPYQCDLGSIVVLHVWTLLNLSYIYFLIQLCFLLHNFFLIWFPFVVAQFHQFPVFSLCFLYRSWKSENLTYMQEDICTSPSINLQTILSLIAFYLLFFFFLSFPVPSGHSKIWTESVCNNFHKNEIIWKLLCTFYLLSASLSFYMMEKMQYLYVN